tara:strand:- start:808 stop:918 length:111 start_codon:yes stop_codon:yes gene_type:complete
MIKKDKLQFTKRAKLLKAKKVRHVVLLLKATQKKVK